MERTLNAPVLEVDGLVKHFDAGHGGRPCTRSTACRSTLGAGRGRSGWSASRAAASRRSATASCGWSSPTAGTIRLHGTDITHLSRRAMRPLRRELHMVFQDPYSSLNPRMTVGDIVGEPLRLHGLARGRELERAGRGAARAGRAARGAARTATRTSCRAASASASGWRAR